LTYVITDKLHFLKRARYRLLKKIPICVGLRVSSPEISINAIIEVLDFDLPRIVFNDQKITKMHDSLPILLFQHKYLVLLYSTGNYPAFCYFFPFVMFNEAISRENINVAIRISWLQLALFFFVAIFVGYRDGEVEENLTQFGNLRNPLSRRQLFDQKLLIHGINTIVALLHFIKSSNGEIYLDRIGTAPLEKKFGMTRLHARTHQTMSSILKTMEIDAALKNLAFYQESKKRKLIYGQIVEGSEESFTFSYNPCVLTDSILKLVDFPIHLHSRGENSLDASSLISYLIQECIVPFAGEIPTHPIPRLCLTLSKSLAGVTASTRQLTLSAKSLTGKCLLSSEGDSIKNSVSKALGVKNITKSVLQMMITQVLEGIHPEMSGPLKSTKKEMWKWVESNWNSIKISILQVASSQRSLDF
jgi:hypothetical protein